MKRPKVLNRASLSGWTKGAPTLEKLKLGRAKHDQAKGELLVPRARLELARQYDPSQDFKSCASTSFATGAKLFGRGVKSDFDTSFCQSL